MSVNPTGDLRTRTLAQVTPRARIASSRELTKDGFVNRLMQDNGFRYTALSLRRVIVEGIYPDSLQPELLPMSGNYLSDTHPDVIRQWLLKPPSINRKVSLDLRHGWKNEVAKDVFKFLSLRAYQEMKENQVINIFSIDLDDFKTFVTQATAFALNNHPYDSPAEMPIRSYSSNDASQDSQSDTSPVYSKHFVAFHVFERLGLPFMVLHLNPTFIGEEAKEVCHRLRSLPIQPYDVACRLQQLSDERYLLIKTAYNSHKDFPNVAPQNVIDMSLEVIGSAVSDNSTILLKRHGGEDFYRDLLVIAEEGATAS